MGSGLRPSGRDRQRWCRHTSTKSGGWEQSNNLQEIQRLRAEQLLTVPPVEPPEGADVPPPTTPAGRGIIDPRTGKPPVFSGDESTWGDWSFKLRSYVSVVDLQLGRMMEAAELAAHASVWIPSEPLNQDMDAQLRYLLVMLTSGPVLQIIRQQPSGVRAFRDLARRYNPRSQARSLTQLQGIMHFDFGQEPAGVTDRMIVFERFAGEHESSSGEALGVLVKCAVLLERVPPELRTHLLLTCGSRPDYAIMRQTVESYSVARRSWQPGHSTTMGEAPMEIDAVYGDKGKKGKLLPRARKARTRTKESTRVNTRAVVSLKAFVVTVESGDTSKKTVDFKKTLLPKWMRRNLSNLQTAVRAAARHEPHPCFLVCFQLELRSPRRERSPR